MFLLLFFRCIANEEKQLIFLFGGKGNTSQVQVFDKKDNNVEIFYLQDINGDHLDQKLNFVPLLFEDIDDDDDNDDDTNKHVLLIGGETELFVPQKDIYSSDMDSLCNHYLNDLKKKGYYSWKHQLKRTEAWIHYF